MKRALLLGAALSWLGFTAHAQPAPKAEIAHGGDYKIGPVDPYTITPTYFPHGFTGASPPPPPPGACPFPNDGGCAGAQATGTIINANMATAGIVWYVSVVPGRGYTNGTGYAISATGCTGSGFAGTVDVSGGQFTNPVITNMGSGYTCRPTISLPGGAGAGTGGVIVPAVEQVTPHTVGGGKNITCVDYACGPNTAAKVSPLVSGNWPAGCSISIVGSNAKITATPCKADGLDFKAANATLTIQGALGAVVGGTQCDAGGTDTHCVKITNSVFKTQPTGADVIGIGAGAADVLFEFDEFDEGATVGGINANSIAAVFDQSTSGTLSVLYSYCHNAWYKCWSLSGVPGSSLVKNFNWAYNGDRNISLGGETHGHGETTYAFSGTLNQHINVNVHDNMELQEWNVGAYPIQNPATSSFTTASTTIPVGVSNPGWGIAGMTVYDETKVALVGTVSTWVGTTVTLTGASATNSAGAADVLAISNEGYTVTGSLSGLNAASEADTVVFDSVVNSNNYLLLPGPWAVTGSDNSNQRLLTSSAALYGGHQGGGTVSNGVMTGNIIDYGGSQAPYNGSSGTMAGDYPGLAGTNATTGTTTCNTTSCN